MIKRDLYIQSLDDVRNTKTIKVLTGVRRVGKSCVLSSYVDKLKEDGIKSEDIIFLNMDLIKYSNLRDYEKLYEYVSSRINDDSMNYLFIDNVSKIKDWWRAVNSLAIEYPDSIDFYICGLDMDIEEADIRKFLNEPVIEINILPLSFREYLQFDKKYWGDTQSIDDKFNDYLHYGGLPVIFEHKKSDLIFNNILKGIYSTIVVKDLLSKNKIKNTLLLEEIFNFAIINQGENISSKKIADYFKTEGVKTTPTTVLDYLKHFDNSYLLYSLKRYNLKCNAYLRTLEKHYIVDLGIRNTLIGFEDEHSQGVLENLVYFELLRRDYKVNMVKYNSHKIDFLGVRPDRKVYYQIVKNLNDDDLLNEKLKDLESIKDNYEKVIICFDKTHTKNIKGIKITNIIDFLLNDDGFGSL